MGVDGTLVSRQLIKEALIYLADNVTLQSVAILSCNDFNIYHVDNITCN